MCQPEPNPRRHRDSAARRLGSLFCLLSFSACSAEAPSGGADPPEPWVDIGLTGGADGLDFVPLEVGGAVPLHTFGQGGTHALLAVRCGDLGDRAFVSITLTNPLTGVEATAPAGPSPRLLLCRAEEICDLLPILVMTGGLIAPGTDGEGQAVHLRAEAMSPDGRAASVEREATLSAALL